MIVKYLENGLCWKCRETVQIAKAEQIAAHDKALVMGGTVTSCMVDLSGRIIGLTVTKDGKEIDVCAYDDNKYTEPELLIG